MSFELEAILESKMGKKGLEYLVKWKGFDASENSWEPEANVEGCTEILELFHETTSSARRTKRKRTPSAKRVASNDDDDDDDDEDDEDDEAERKQHEEQTKEGNDDKDDDDRDEEEDESATEDDDNNEDEDDDDDYVPEVMPTSKRRRVVASDISVIKAEPKPKVSRGQSKASWARAQPKSKVKVNVEKRLLAMPLKQVCAAVAEFVRARGLEQEFADSLPAADTAAFEEALAKGSRAIFRALPNTRYGSSTDHYGYKRCCSAVVAFKKLWNEQVATLAFGMRSPFISYANTATETLRGCCAFDVHKDNKYKELCAKKLSAALKKLLKAKDIQGTETSSIDAILADLSDFIPT